MRQNNSRQSKCQKTFRKPKGDTTGENRHHQHQRDTLTIRRSAEWIKLRETTSQHTLLRNQLVLTHWFIHLNHQTEMPSSNEARTKGRTPRMQKSIVRRPQSISRLNLDGFFVHSLRWNQLVDGINYQPHSGKIKTTRQLTKTVGNRLSSRQQRHKGRHTDKKGSFDAKLKACCG